MEGALVCNCLALPLCSPFRQSAPLEQSSSSATPLVQRATYCVRLSIDDHSRCEPPSIALRSALSSKRMRVNSAAIFCCTILGRSSCFNGGSPVSQSSTAASASSATGSWAMITSWRCSIYARPKLHDCLSPSLFGVAITGVRRNRAQDRIVGIALFPTAIERLTIEW